MATFVGVVDGNQRGKENEQRIAEAIKHELKQMLDYNVWTPIKRDKIPRDVKIIPSKMFTIEKYGPDGKYLKHKSRLVAGGHREWIPINLDTSSPTVRLETIYVALNLSAHYGFGIDTMDVGGAFLEADLRRDDVYVSLESKISSLLVELERTYKEYVDHDGKIIVKLTKALYGLKEASMEWYQHLIKVLKEFGFEISKYDSAMLYKKQGGNKIVHIIVLHVDDMMSIGTKSSRDKLVDFLKRKFKKVTINRDERTHQYVGLVIRKDNNGSIHISQPGLIKEITKEFGLDAETASVTPCDEKLFTDKQDDDTLIPDPDKYRSHVMKMMYLTRSRPDIKLPITYLSTKMQSPTRGDYVKLYKVAKYLNMTKSLELRFTPQQSMEVRCSADASFAVHKDAKGQTGFCIWIGNQNAPIHVQSKKQQLVTRSSTEAEMVALTSAGEEVLWIRGLLEELGFTKQPSTEIEQDNTSCITLSNKGSGRAGRARAINVRYFWITDHIEDGTFTLKHVPSEQLIADGFTKPMARDRFLKWRDRILNLEED